MSPTEAIHDLGRMILTIRGTKVIVDSDLAVLYGVSTMAFNQAVKRNRERFPESFRFQLERQEFMNMRSQFVIAFGKRNIRHLPYVFTEHGALMAANVLKSPKAVKMSIALIEAFVRLRQELASTRELARRLAEIEKTVIAHDQTLEQLFDVIRPLLAPPPETPSKEIGFHTIKPKKPGTARARSSKRKP